MKNFIKFWVNREGIRTVHSYLFKKKQKPKADPWYLEIIYMILLVLLIIKPIWFFIAIGILFIYLVYKRNLGE